MPINSDYIISFLRQVEGGSIAEAYVPISKGQPIQNSGVTLGTGVDLGQQSEEGLLKMGLPSRLVGLLKPYLGLKREAAVAKIRVQPLRLNAHDLKILDSSVIGHYIRQTSQHFDHEAGKEAFAQRPKELQAVATSLHYQLGSPRSYPKTWSYLVQSKNQAAIDELENPAAWSFRYSNRRKQEAALLRKLNH